MIGVAFLRRTVERFRRIYCVRIKKDLLVTSFYKWQDACGDETLRLDYPISDESLIFDIGGYVGDFSASMHCRYNCSAMLFEPVKEYYQKSALRFKENKKIKVYDFGLSDRTFEAEIDVKDVSSSLHNRLLKRNAPKEKIRLVSVADFINDNDIKQIDLMKINIEGGEYCLLEELIQTGLIERIRYVQVQYHLFVPGATEKRVHIQGELEKTHSLMWSYPFIWESWKRR
jgi:FkbM family methyltransferase